MENKHRKLNVLIFSAGESLTRAKECKNKLIKEGINAYTYKDIFLNVNNKNQIALLPSLIKKIPTFDFIILIAEAVDQVKRSKKIKEKTMRDNLLLEIGFSCMALGIKRVILLLEDGVRIPEDLIGIGGEIGLKTFVFKDEKNFDLKTDQISQTIKDHKKALDQYYDDVISKIYSYINSTFKEISPVMVGASVSNAEAYYSNFIKRLVENAHKGFYDCNNKHRGLDSYKIKIVFPEKIYNKDILKDNIMAYYKENKCQKARIANANSRDLYFNYIEKDGFIEIVDIPTNITASYSLIKQILEIESDEKIGDETFNRFMTKELDIFKYVLEILAQKDGLTPEKIFFENEKL